MTENVQTTQLHEEIRARRSVRRFEDRPVPEEVIKRVLETATSAPSAHNRQPWRFVMLTSLEGKTRLAQAMGAEYHRVLLAEGFSPEEAADQVGRSRSRVMDAPVAIVICLDPSVMDDYKDDNRRQGEYLMAVQSVAMAGGYLLLAAHAEGLGGVWTCAPLFVPDIVRATLDLPDEWVAQGLILLGYADRDPDPKSRRPVEDVSIFR